MVSLDAFLFCLFIFRVLETSKLNREKNATMFEILNFTRPLTSRPPTTSRNDWADLMSSSMKPAHDPEAIQHGAGREMKPFSFIGISTIIE